MFFMPGIFTSIEDVREPWSVFTLLVGLISQGQTPRPAVQTIYNFSCKPKVFQKKNKNYFFDNAFSSLISLVSSILCHRGGIGRRKGLKIPRLFIWPCQFNSGRWQFFRILAILNNMTDIQKQKIYEVCKK